MNKLTLSFTNSPITSTAVVIDGNLIVAKKDKNRTIYVYETEKQEVSLNIFSVHEFTGKFWWFFAFIYNLISVFGIFNPKYEKTGKVFDYKGVVVLNGDTQIKMSYPIAKVGNIALKFFDCEYLNNETNVYFTNEEIKKRAKAFKGIQIATIIVVLLSVLAIIFL